MNATQARAKTTQVLNSDMQEIYNEIREACLNKQFSISISRDLSEDEAKVLRDLGYEVTYNKYGETTTIRW